jgi:hypothetical protein
MFEVAYLEHSNSRPHLEYINWQSLVKPEIVFLF